MTASRQLSYAVLGAVTSLAAPAGLLLLRLASGSAGSIVDELVLNRVTYAYVFAASAIALTIFGYAMGRQADVLHRLATTDPLTGLLNRRAIDERLQHEHGRAQRYGLPLSLLLIDLDGLKRVNDTSGHAAGDQVIRGAAQAIRGTLRASDYGGRWGGDEFLIVAPHTSRESARRLAERVAAHVANRARTGSVTATACVGVATFEGGGAAVTARSLIEAADRALYDAKESGRSTVSSST
jgi:diguanylate cyclase (GGDEF)-like protein